MVGAPTAAEWGVCAYCGDAVPPTAAACPICGAANPVRAAQLAAAPHRVRLRLRLLGALRVTIVVAAVLLLGYAIISGTLTGPPVIADPLTTSGSYVIAPGNATTLAGEITGADYVLGNFSVLAPFGTAVGLVVYNTSEYQNYLSGQLPGGNQSSIAPSNSAPIQFAAPYTDTYYFVFYNSYPVSSGFNVTVYIQTAYTPNVNSFGG